MKTKTLNPAQILLAKIASVAPSIAIQILWSHDCGMTDIRKECDGFENENSDDWQAWQSEVKATAIVNGVAVSGSDYLGGTWEKACDHPAQSNPEISGYLPDMVRGALSDLRKQLPVEVTEQTAELAAQIDAALSV